MLINGKCSLPGFELINDGSVRHGYDIDRKTVNNCKQQK